MTTNETIELPAGLRNYDQDFLRSCYKKPIAIHMAGCAGVEQYDYRRSVFDAERMAALEAHGLVAGGQQPVHSEPYRVCGYYWVYRVTPAGARLLAEMKAA